MSMHKKQDLKFAKVIYISSYIFCSHVSIQSNRKLQVESPPGLRASSKNETVSKTSYLREA